MQRFKDNLEFVVLLGIAVAVGMTLAPYLSSLLVRLLGF